MSRKINSNILFNVECLQDSLSNGQIWLTKISYIMNIYRRYNWAWNLNSMKTIKIENWSKSGFQQLKYGLQKNKPVLNSQLIICQLFKP